MESGINWCRPPAMPSPSPLPSPLPGDLVDLQAAMRGWGSREWVAIATSLPLMVLMALARATYMLLAPASSGEGRPVSRTGLRMKKL